MSREEIHDALESTAPNKKAGRSFERVTPNRQDIISHKNYLLHFLEEIEGDISVSELRDALEEYS